MTLKEAIKTAVTSHNLQMISRILEKCRNDGLNYNDTQALFEKCSGIDSFEFEGLMQECDEYESQN